MSMRIWFKTIRHECIHLDEVNDVKIIEAMKNGDIQSHEDIIDFGKKYTDFELDNDIDVMSVMDNCGYSTVSLFDDDSNYICGNGKD